EQEGLAPGRIRLGEGGVGWLVGQVRLTGEEAQHRLAPPGGVVADRAAQPRVAGLQRVEDRALSGRALDGELDLGADLRQRPQMERENDSDHGRVWTSTDSTAGKWETAAAQLSPASAETYTWPPVVPK